MASDRTYDQIQCDAQLVVCQSCGKAYYMTVVRPICVVCVDQAERQARA